MATPIPTAAAIWKDWWESPEVLTSEASFREAESHVSLKKRVLYLYLSATAIVWYEISGWIFGWPGRILQILFQVYVAVLCWPGKVGQWQGQDRLQIRAILLVYITFTNVLLCIPVWLLFLADRSWNVAAIANMFLLLTTGSESDFLLNFAANWEFVAPFRLAFLSYVTWYLLFDGNVQKGALFDRVTGEKIVKVPIVAGGSLVGEETVIGNEKTGDENNEKNVDGRKPSLTAAGKKKTTKQQHQEGSLDASQDSTRSATPAEPGSPKYLQQLAEETELLPKLSTSNLLEFSELRPDGKPASLSGSLSSRVGSSSSSFNAIDEGEAGAVGSGLEGRISKPASIAGSEIPLPEDPVDEDGLDDIFYNHDGIAEYGNDDEAGSDVEGGISPVGPMGVADLGFELVDPAEGREGSSGGEVVSSKGKKSGAGKAATASSPTHSTPTPTPARRSSVHMTDSSPKPKKSFSIIRFSKKVIESPFLVARFSFLFAKAIYRRLRHPASRDRFWPSCRRRRFYKHMALYFPIRLTRTAKLDPSKKYIFGYHPHGIISIGAFINFATYATGFDALFPGIDLRLLTLSLNFKVPLFRDLILSLGLNDASRESIINNLDRGKSIMLVPGGAQESLLAKTGRNELVLEKRKGFVKLALLTGASLVPVYSFGETDVFECIDLKEGSFMSGLQLWLQRKLGFALPLMYGRSLTGGLGHRLFGFQRGVFPFRTVIHSIVGAPIPCPKTAPEDCTNELVAKYHSKYVEALSALHNTWKPMYEKEKMKRISQLEKSSAARKKALENEKVFGGLKKTAGDMRIAQ